MAVQKVRITHTGANNVGELYLADVGRRNSLGGGASIYEYGQDIYLHPPTTDINPVTGVPYLNYVDLVATSQVLLSIDRGIIYTYSNGDFAGTLTVVFL